MLRMSSDEQVLKRIEEQLEMARRELEASRNSLDNIVAQFVLDIRQNLEGYIIQNVRREIRKNPEIMAGIADEKIAEMRDKLSEIVATVGGKLVSELCDYPGWYDVDVDIIDLNSGAWKSIKAIEPPINEILKSYGLRQIDLKNWNWLSEDIDRLVAKEFPGVKKNYIEKNKVFNYFKCRYEEEARVGGILSRLDRLDQGK